MTIRIHVCAHLTARKTTGPEYVNWQKTYWDCRYRWGDGTIVSKVVSRGIAVLTILIEQKHF
jgi:hypothetical protein